MLRGEPHELVFSDSGGDVGMHAHHDALGWAMMLVGGAGTWLADHFLGLCSLGVMCCGLYLNWRNGEARQERLRRQWEREWVAAHPRDQTTS